MKHFCEHRNPTWKENHDKWDYAWDHYTGTYADWEEDVAKVTDYLHQKYQRENNKAYEERQKISDVVLHFATIVDGINGVLATKEKDTKREWGALGEYDGDELLPDSIAYRLLNNADGNGTNLTPLMKSVGIKQTVLHSVWGYVEGVVGDNDAHIKIIMPQHVVNWFPQTGELTEVLVKEDRDVRDSIYADPNSEGDIYTLFTLDGWRRFKVEDDVEVTLEEGEYQYWEDSRRKKRILPIFRTEIPMPRQVGYLLAKKENHIYNATSVRDFALRNLSFAILNLNVSDDKEYNSILNHLEKGANVLGSYSDKGAHSFISPDSSYLTSFEDVLQNKIQEYYTNGFKKFGEAASQTTATEIRLENQSGIEAFLALLVSSIDEFENQCLKRLEQVYFPERPSLWGQATVVRSRNFQAEDLEETFRKRAESVRTLRQSNTISLEEAIRRINPTWTEEQVAEEASKINAERGASIPDPFLNG